MYGNQSTTVVARYFPQSVSDALICEYCWLYNVDSDLRYVSKYANKARYINTTHVICDSPRSYGKSEYVNLYILINGHTRNVDTSSKEILYNPKLMIENVKPAVVVEQISTNITTCTQGIIGCRDYQISDIYCNFMNNYNSIHEMKHLLNIH